MGTMVDTISQSPPLRPLEKEEEEKKKKWRHARQLSQPQRCLLQSTQPRSTDRKVTLLSKLALDYSGR